MRLEKEKKLLLHVKRFETVNFALMKLKLTGLSYVTTKDVEFVGIKHLYTLPCSVAFLSQI